MWEAVSSPESSWSRHELPIAGLLTASHFYASLGDCGTPPPACQKPVEEEQNHGTDDRCDDSRAFAGVVVPPHCAPEEARQQGAGDTDQHGYDDPARITSRHDQLGDSPNNESDDQGPQESHSSVPSKVDRRYTYPRA